MLHVVYCEMFVVWMCGCVLVFSVLLLLLLLLQLSIGVICSKEQLLISVLDC